MINVFLLFKSHNFAAIAKKKKMVLRHFQIVDLRICGDIRVAIILDTMIGDDDIGWTGLKCWNAGIIIHR